MGVYIKNMEMPTRCEDCPMGFSVNFGILCTPTHNIVGDGEISKKQNWCPLIPVTPHGDLIDRDAYIKDQCSHCDGWCDDCYCDCLNCASDHKCDFIIGLADAPTIIEEGS